MSYAPTCVTFFPRAHVLGRQDAICEDIEEGRSSEGGVVPAFSLVRAVGV
jgi:hypothetical protein